MLLNIMPTKRFVRRPLKRSKSLKTSIYLNASVIVSIFFAESVDPNVRVENTWNGKLNILMNKQFYGYMINLHSLDAPQFNWHEMCRLKIC